MPRVHYVKKARKDNPVVKRGESYYWWKHAFGAKQFSKTRPKPSQLTQSPFLSQIYSLQESIEDGYFESFDDVESQRDELVSELQNLLDECQESFDNMPEQLQDTSDAGMTLQERIDTLENSISEIESLDIPECEGNEWMEDYDEYEIESMTDEEREQQKEEWKQEQVNEFIQSINDVWPEV